MARMVTKSKPGMNRKKRRFSTSIREQTQCRFCRKGEEYIDYKDIDTLQKLLTHRGKIFSRFRLQADARKQRNSNKSFAGRKSEKFYPASETAEIDYEGFTL